MVSGWDIPRLRKCIDLLSFGGRKFGAVAKDKRQSARVAELNGRDIQTYRELHAQIERADSVKRMPAGFSLTVARFRSFNPAFAGRRWFIRTSAPHPPKRPLPYSAMA